jgi:hypothetical protein
MAATRNSLRAGMTGDERRAADRDRDARPAYVSTAATRAAEAAEGAEAV